MAATNLVVSYGAGRTSNKELLMLVLYFKVNYRPKILKGISVECMESLNKDA